MFIYTLSKTGVLMMSVQLGRISTIKESLRFAARQLSNTYNDK